MKSIEDYVYLEPKFYQDVLDEHEKLFYKKFEAVDLSQVKDIVIYATGSSSNAAFGALPFISEVLGLPVRVEEPSISENYLMNIDNNTLNIAISQGGHSYSIVELVDRLQKKGHVVFALTSEMDSPLAKKSKNLLSMGMPVEEMPYVSAGYSVTILDLMLISLGIALKINKITKEKEEDYIKSISGIIDKLPDVIDKSSKWVDNHLQDLSKAKRMMFIGYGATYGVSREGETKITETVRISAWGKELEEYMHGPYLGLHSDDYVVFIESTGKLEKRADLLKKFLNKHVKNVFTIYANSNNTDIKNLNLGMDTNELLTSLFMTVPVHLMSYRLSKLCSINLEESAFPDFDEITSSKI